MARRIIILDRTLINSGAWRYKYALWATVPSERRQFCAKPDFETRVGDASPAEVTALQDGTVVERIEAFEFSQGTQMAEIQSDLINKWTAFQTEVNAYNPWRFMYTNWDDAETWHLNTIA